MKIETVRLRHPLGALGLVTAIALSAPSQAALDGKTDLICSVTDVIGCPDAGTCVQGQARNFDLPHQATRQAGRRGLHHAGGIQEKEEEDSCWHVIASGSGISG